MNMKLSCEFCLIPNLVQRGHHKTSLTLVHTKYLKNNFFFVPKLHLISARKKRSENPLILLLFSEIYFGITNEPVLAWWYINSQGYNTYGNKRYFL